MNTKKFFAIVGTTTLVCLVLAVAAITLFFFFGADSLGGNNIESTDKTLPNGRINILVLGTDEGGLRSDVIMLFSLCRSEQNINLLSIPRDTRVKIGNNFQKINAALAIGKEDLAVRSVKSILGVPIHHYVTVNFQAVVDVVDALGGVEFDVPQNMDYVDDSQDLYIHLKKGLQKLDGDKSLQLLRFRSYPTADLERIKVQQDFMSELFRQKLSLKYLTKIPEVYSAAMKNTKTDLSLSEVTKYGAIAKSMSADSMNTYELPGKSQTIGGGSYYIINTAETRTLMDENFK